MGRNNSAFVLEGSHEDIKNWTTRGITYKSHTLGIPSSVWQEFTRLGSLLMLLFIFSSLRNRSTVDQVAFIILNGPVQLNVLIGQRLNSECYLAQLERLQNSQEQTRTHIYVNLIRRFKKIEHDKSWVDASCLLPKTEIWDQ